MLHGADIAIGRIRRTHGVKGYLKVMSYSGEWEHFYTLDAVTLKQNGQVRYYQVEKVIPHGGEILFKLEGIDSPEAGRLLGGWEIWVPREQAAVLKPDEYYHADLEGCKVLLEGCVVGSVLRLREAGGDDLLEIDTGKGIKLVPFSRVFIGKVDIQEKKIELLEGWILD